MVKLKLLNGSQVAHECTITAMLSPADRVACETTQGEKFIAWDIEIVDGQLVAISWQRQ